ncbi:MAG TPA: WD40 repeat domain-containing protein, partial [Nitrosopumilaceae archaeon]|nr:WD40 repeat domain-containing protein [Nitrosopumilaceae archaeon]
MKKYDIQFTESMLKHFTPFISTETVFTSNFVIFKNAKEKINIAFYVDTCYNHYNLISEYKKDLPTLFGLTEEQTPEIFYENKNSSRVFNTDAFARFASDSAKTLLPAFTDYSKITANCFYNNYSKAKIYVIINYEGNLDDQIAKEGDPYFCFLFHPHLSNSEIEPELTLNSGLNDYIDVLTCTPSGKLMAYAGVGGVIKIMLGDGSKQIRSIKAHAEAINKLSFSENERLLASCSLDSTIKIWEVETGKLIATLRGHKNRVNDADFFDNDRKLMSTSSDSTIRLWDVEKKTAYRTINDFKSKAALFAISFKNNKAVVDIQNGNLLTLDLKTNKYTILKSGINSLTDICFPYRNVIVISDGINVKMVDIELGADERIISDAADSAFTKFAYKITEDNNMLLILMTEHGYCKIYDYIKHEVGSSFNFGKFDKSDMEKTYYKIIYNREYDLAFCSSRSRCLSYDLKNKWFDYIWGTGRIPFGVEPDKKNETVAINFMNETSIFSLKSGRIIWNSIGRKLEIFGLAKISKHSGNLLFTSSNNELITYDYSKNEFIYRFKPKSYADRFVILQNDSSFLYKTKTKEVYLHTSGVKSDKKITSGYTIKDLVLIRDTFILAQQKRNIYLLNVYTGDKIFFEKQTE